MQKIDETRLESDLGYRFEYMTQFIGFGADDIAAIHDVADVLVPFVPHMVDAIYVKLFAYDCTKRHFLPQQHGYQGQVPTTLDELTLDHPQIAFRKQHLGNYLVKLVTAPYDAKFLIYLDMVGKIHTAKAGNKAIQIPLVQMNSLMGFLADVLTATLVGLNLPREVEIKTLRAFNKLLWIQNDLATRHYCA